MRRFISPVLIAFLFAACAGEEGPTSKGRGAATSPPAAQATTPAEPECADLRGSPVARIVMDDFIFDPALCDRHGRPKARVVNEGKNRHSFTVPKLDFDVLSGKTKTTKQPIGDVLKPGGTHAYVCKYHRPMKGELRVG